MNLFNRKHTLEERADEPKAYEGGWVSRGEFASLAKKFDALCEHLGVTIRIPYKPTVEKRSKNEDAG